MTKHIETPVAWLPAAETSRTRGSGAVRTCAYIGANPNAPNAPMARARAPTCTCALNAAVMSERALSLSRRHPPTALGVAALGVAPLSVAALGAAALGVAALGVAALGAAALLGGHL